MRKVNIIYWKYNYGLGNFGDELSHILTNTILDKSKTKLYHNHRDNNHDSMIGVGSYIHAGKEGDRIWGSGILDNFKHNNLDKLKYHSVRGYKTIDKIKKAGVNTENIKIGDPALILPYLYKPEMNDKFRDKIIIIPNHAKMDLYERRMKEIKDKDNEYILIDPCLTNIKTIIDAIYSSKFVISSSLHGLIISDAYKKPNVWFYEKMEYGDFKYYDYYSSIKIDEPKFIKNIDEWTDVKYDRNYIIGPKEIYDAFPFEKNSYESLKECIIFDKYNNDYKLNYKENTKENYVISIGEYCIVAKLLEKLNIKKETFPFDWIFSNLKFVKDCIDNNFEPLLEIIRNKKTDGDKEYQNCVFKKIGIPHHNVNDEKTLEYFIRRKENFEYALNSKKDIYLLHIVGSSDYKVEIEDYINLVYSLRKKYDNNNINIISINFKENNNKGYELIEEMNINDMNLKKYVISMNKKNDISNWLDNINYYFNDVKKILIENNINFDVSITSS
tara:strand:+ start:149 stop:1648 length:1500 start_codon:yes stop_codon:yes gene_type:complete